MNAHLQVCPGCCCGGRPAERQHDGARPARQQQLGVVRRLAHDTDGVEVQQLQRCPHPRVQRDAALRRRERGTLSSPGDLIEQCHQLE